MTRETPDTAVDRWYTEPWTKWRIFEYWARSLTVGLCCIAILAVSLQVSKEFTAVMGWLAFFFATLDRALPNSRGDD